MNSASENIYFKDLDTTYNSVNSVLTGDFRLDSGYYTNIDSVVHLANTEPLSNFCSKVFMGPIFKRTVVPDEKNGVRFFASNEIVSLSPEITYLLTEQANKLNLIVKKGMILVTGYGTIGSLRIVDDIIDGFAIADNVTRIIPKDNLGYVACFLSSKYGHQLLNDYASGSAVRFIQAPSIAKIPVPVLDEKTVKSIDEKYLSAVTCREKAHELLEKADSLVHKYNNLPPLSEINFETIDPSKETQIRLTNLSEFTESYRLDAHFYNPTAKQAVENITQKIGRSKQLSELSEDIIMGKRFKRNYVESNFGTPFLSGKNIIQIRPADINHLSDTEISFIDDLLVKKNWTMITCSGTLGRTCFVYNNYEDYAASQHILRVVPNESLIDAGYLNCFLASDYGFHQLLKYKYGSVIDEIDDKNIATVQVPIPSDKQQKEIGDLVRKAYDYRADAIRLEDEAQEILTQALTKNK
jgi:type I restriction enzyme S subunit